MSYSIAWNEAFPAGSNAANQLALFIQQKQVAVRERLDDIFGTTSAPLSIVNADPYLPALLKLGGAANSKIIPGATSLSLRNAADTEDNLYVDNDGNVKVRKNLRVDTGVGYIDRVSNGNFSASTDLDLATGNTQAGVLANANTIFVFLNPIAGAFYTLELKQDATGGRTVTWPSSVKWPGGTAPTLTTTAGRTDIISLYYNGTNFAGVLAASDVAL